MKWNPSLWRCVLGNVRTSDDVVLNALKVSRRNTGADLFSMELDTRVHHLLSLRTAPDMICAEVVASLNKSMQIGLDGSVFAAPDAGGDDQWRTKSWLKQGHAAAVVIFLMSATPFVKTDAHGVSYNAHARQAQLIVDHIKAQQWPSASGGEYPLFRCGGLWPFADRFKTWNRGWEYAGMQVACGEDGTFLWYTCLMSEFGEMARFDAALNGIDQIALANGGYRLPTNANVRDGLPISSRGCSLAFYDVDLTARCAVLLAHAQRTPVWSHRVAEMSRWIAEWKLPIAPVGGQPYWHRFICPQRNQPVYPKADPADARRQRAINYWGEPTYDVRESIAGGFDQPTPYPAFLASIGV